MPSVTGQEEVVTVEQSREGESLVSHDINDAKVEPRGGLS